MHGNVHPPEILCNTSPSELEFLHGGKKEAMGCIFCSFQLFREVQLLSLIHTLISSSVDDPGKIIQLQLLQLLIRIADIFILVRKLKFLFAVFTGKVV